MKLWGTIVIWRDVERDESSFNCWGSLLYPLYAGTRARSHACFKLHHLNVIHTHTLSHIHLARRMHNHDATMSSFSWLFHSCIAQIDFFYSNLWKQKAGKSIGDRFRHIDSVSLLEFRQCACSFLPLFRSCTHTPYTRRKWRFLANMCIGNKKGVAFVQARCQGPLHGEPCRDHFWYGSNSALLPVLEWEEIAAATSCSSFCAHSSCGCKGQPKFCSVAGQRNYKTRWNLVSHRTEVNILK